MKTTRKSFESLIRLERALAVAGVLALGWVTIAWLDARIYQSKAFAELERAQQVAELEALPEQAGARGLDPSAPESQQEEPAERGADAEEAVSLAARGAAKPGSEPESAAPEIDEVEASGQPGPRPSPAAAVRPRGAQPAVVATAGKALAGEPLGLLQVPRLGLSVMVAEGVGSRTLRRAVGHLPETPLPGEPGNAAIAGHRDSHFLPLRDIIIGDEIRLRTAQGVLRYEVEWVRIVEPTAVHVLDPTDYPALTLITCYPFSHLGNAPDRYVVRARQVG